MKILHLGSNDKFIMHAYNSFENVYPGQNKVMVFCASHLENQYQDHKDFQRIGQKNLINPFFYQGLKQYDYIVIHSLIPQFIALINNAPKDLKFLWLGWGYDYYKYIFKTAEELLLPHTLEIEPHPQTQKKFTSFIRKCIKILLREHDYQAAIKKITSFSPVLPEDYELIQKSGILNHIPPYHPWNYGSLEEAYIRDFHDQRVNGNAILIGNSADINNNHIDAFHLIQSIKDRHIVCPLSYGDNGHLPSIQTVGTNIFGSHFKPLLGFIPIDDYIDTLRSCSFVIMNHKRQQGVGTIVQMMYLGAKLFLREECPTYHFFKKQNAFIYSIQDLEKDLSLLEHPLTPEQIEENIKILKHHWSRQAINEKTRNLIESCTKDQ